MHRQVRNASPNQRLGDSTPWQFDHQFRIIAPKEIGVLLGPNDSHRRDRLAVYQKLFMGLVPLIDRLGSVIHAPVFLVGPDMMPPGLKSTRDTLEHPQASFRRRFARLTE